jgi:hypothetical protein
VYAKIWVQPPFSAISRGPTEFLYRTDPFSFEFRLECRAPTNDQTWESRTRVQFARSAWASCCLELSHSARIVGDKVAAGNHRCAAFDDKPVRRRGARDGDEGAYAGFFLRPLVILRELRVVRAPFEAPPRFAWRTPQGSLAAAWRRTAFEQQRHPEARGAQLRASKNDAGQEPLTRTLDILNQI